MDGETKEVLLAILECLDKIRKNTEILSKANGGHTMASKDKVVEKLLGKIRSTSIPAEIIEEDNK